MLTRDHLLTAVERDIITQDQATALTELAGENQADSEGQVVIARGFNDIFVAVGAALIVVACYWAVLLTESSVFGLLVSLAIFWGLSEFLVRRMGMVTPGFVFVVAIALTLGAIFTVLGGTRLMSVGDVVARMSWLFCLGGLVGAIGYYFRFRLPFAMLLIGALVPATVYTAIIALYPDLHGSATQRLVALLGGLVVFFAAMRFDFADRERTRRESQCAFWLHFVAAPLLVHSVIGSLITSTSSLTGFDALAIIVITAIVAVIALAIDRRAILMVSLIYAGLAIGYIVSQTGASVATIGLVTLLILGTGVTVLGAGWLPLRRRVLALLPYNLVERLPKLPQ